MKKRLIRTILSIVTGIFIGTIMPVLSFSEDLILDGVYAENIPLGGKSEQEATDAINLYLKELSNRSITLYTVNDNEVTVTPEDLGFAWANPEIISEAAAIGHTGNIVERYKTQKDLNYSGQILDIKFSIDDAKVRNVLSEQCAAYNMAAKDGTISMESGSFDITEGQVGMVVDVDASAAGLEDFFLNQWSGQNTTYQLVIKIDTPNGTYEDLALVKDCLGSFHTSFKTSSASRSSNVRNGASLINGSVIYPGEEYSFYDHVKPFSYDNGYQLAAAYSSGQVVDSVGGGICQVSSTLYNSVLLSELEVTERRNHGMIVTYVDPARDATIAESAGTDFRFKNNTDAPIYIDAYTTDDKQLYISIYGHETRPAGRTVDYESEVISRTQPGPDVYIEDPTHPIGYISTQSAHTGLKANLWKVVTENGQTERELVNTSVYNAAPKYITVGTATEDPSAAAALSAALASGDTENVKSTAASLKSAADAGISADAQALAQYEAALAAMNSSEEPSE
ncbi:MAG: VanW family protein [Lachnospiraceae bacterium]|nr:VanW family protein [Lachnospiraceae bacterium]